MKLLKYSALKALNRGDFMSDGFEGLEGLDNFTKSMMDLANNKMPKESKKFLKKNTGQLSRATKKKAKSLGIGEESGKYMESFKAGKTYNYQGALSCRALNSSPHAHLIENGFMWKPHKKVAKGQKKKQTGGEKFMPGFHPFEKAYKDFISKYYNNCEQFISDMLEKGL